MNTIANNYPRKQSSYNSYIYALFIGLVIYFALELEIQYVLAITIFIHQFFALYFKLGDRIPVRNLVGMMFSLNYLISPLLMYLWLDPFSTELREMKVDPQAYFSYAIPAILLLLIGLNIGAKPDEEKIKITDIENIVERYPRLPLILILVGVAAGLAQNYVPSVLQYICFTLAYLKVIGLFISILSKKGFNIWYFLLSYGLLILGSLTSSMWNDLLNMLFFLGFFLCLKYKPSNTLKLVGIAGGVLFVFFIQIIKFPLRASVGAQFDVEKFNEAIKTGRSEAAQNTREEKVLTMVTRINQGWFFSSTLANYQRGGFNLQKGNHAMVVLATAALPKFIAPNRINIGDPVLFNKYSGHYLYKGTSMALGILSDGFIDFGYNGIYVVFAFGLILNFFVKFYHKLNDKYLFAKIFAPLGFFYSIRPDTDTQSALGAALKGAIIIWVLLVIIQKFYYSNAIEEGAELSPE